MSATVDVDLARVPVVVEDVIRPLVAKTAEELWNLMRDLDPNRRIGHTQLHGLAEIARNQPDLLENFITRQRTRAERAAGNGSSGASDPYVRFWSTLKRGLEDMLKGVSDVYMQSKGELSKQQRQKLRAQIHSTYVPIWAVLLSIEYLYRAAR